MAEQQIQAHYPSTATLAAFRRSIDPAKTFPGNQTKKHRAPGAHPWERRHGIGQSSVHGPNDSERWPRGLRGGTFARREASAMRSRAWDRSVALRDDYREVVWSAGITCMMCKHAPGEGPMCGCCNRAEELAAATLTEG
jgi:hypothetical protein